MKKSTMLAQTAATEHIVSENLTTLLDLPQETNWDLVNPNKLPKEPGKPGRPKGTPNKLSAKTILDAIEQKDGQTFAEGLADDYLAARNGPDKHLVVKYQTLILSKVLADKVDIEVIDQAKIIETKALAFKAALEHLALRESNLIIQDDNDNK